MHDLISKSLAQIVNSNHRAAAVFEKYHLDFCCKGKRTLQQACTESNLNVEEVLTAIEQAKPVNSGTVPLHYEKLSLAQLSDYIVNTHHSYVKKEMPLLLGYLQKVAAKHGDRHPEMLKVLELFAAVKEEMEHHMQKEELVLFPRITETERQVNQGKELVVNGTYLLSPVTTMEQEHDHAGSILAEIRKLTNDYTPPADACTTYQLSFAALQAFELDLHQHVHLENNILFPRALQLFGTPGSPSLN
jgi:regulator of cell morphogenesis and NO signaling